MAVDTYYKIHHEYKKCRPDPMVPGSRWTIPSFALIFRELVDIVQTAVISQYVFQQIPRRFTSASVANRFVDDITSIDWGSTTLTLKDRKRAYFDQISDFIALQDDEEGLNVFANLVLFVSMLRVVQATNLHPRLGILTGTVANALDDLFHFIMLVIIVFVCFACIGVWRFGHRREDFADFRNVMGSMLVMLLGELPDNWMQLNELMAYVFAYIFLVFFLVQNFLLAIIVEAYMTVRQEYVRMQTENSFPVDTIESFQSLLKGLIHGWPMPGKLASAMEPWYARVSVGFEDLYGTGLFRGERTPCANCCPGPSFRLLRL